MFVSTEWLMSLVTRDCSVLQIITEPTYWKGSTPRGRIKQQCLVSKARKTSSARRKEVIPTLLPAERICL